MRFTLALAAVLSFAFHATAATVTSSHSGAWDQSSTWSGGVIPGEGDTISVADGHTVTVNDARVVGASGDRGTVAIHLRNTGAIVIASGGVLSVRGDTGYTGTNGKEAVIVQPGGVWEFDSSQGSRTAVTFGPEINGAFRSFVAKGTAASPAVVRSKTGGPNGRFSLNGHNGGGSFTAAYASFSHIGDAASPGWQVAYENSGSHLVRWDVTHSSFVACGAIAGANDVGVATDGVFVHNRNVHTNSAAPEIFTHWLNISPAGKGTRELRGNVFDVSASRTALYPTGFTISGNYFGDGSMLGGYWAWNSWNDNFVRLTDWWGQTGNSAVAFGDVNNTYLFVDSEQGNPHVMLAQAGIASNLNGIVFGQAGAALGPPGPKDSGELWFLTNPNAPATYGIYNSIMLPNMAGYSSLEIGSMLPAYANLHSVTEHNTWFGGWVRGAGEFGFPAIVVGEGGNGAAASVNSFRGNILWNPQLAGHKSTFYKLADLSRTPAPVLDYCAPANCDYNTGYGHLLTDKSRPQYTNQGKGYAAKFSAPPGVHDVDADPKFLDWQRSVELFDSKYLGNKPRAWATGTAYKAGDFVQSSDPGVYWALPVNYRYVNEGACRNTNPKPGSGPNWRSCWEWASLYRLRQGVVSGQAFTDPAIGAQREDIVATMIKWIRAGYVPGNAALLDAAHDGYDIGAVQSCSSRRSQALEVTPGTVCAPSLKTPPVTKK
jgi:hypothetical protein